MAAKDIHKGKQTPSSSQPIPRPNPQQNISHDEELQLAPPSDSQVTAVPMGEDIPALAAEGEVPSLAPGQPVFEDEGAKNTREPTVILNFMRGPGEPEPGEEVPQPEVPPAIPLSAKKTGQIQKPAPSKVVTPTFAPTKVPTAPKAAETKAKQVVLNFEELSYAAMQTELPRIVLNLFKQHPGWQNVPDSKITASPVYLQMLDKANKGYENWHDAEARARVEIKSYQATAERARGDVQKILAGQEKERQELAAEKQRLETLRAQTQKEITDLESKLNEERNLKFDVNSSKTDYEQKLSEVEQERVTVAKDRASLEHQKKDFEQLVAEYEHNAAQLEAQKAELDTQRRTNDTVASSLGSAQKAYDRKQEEISKGAAALEAERKQIEAERQALEASKADASTVAQKTLDDSRLLDERIAVYKQNLTAYEAAKKALDGERATLQEGFRQVEQQEEALKGAQDALGKQRLDLETIADQKARALLKGYEAKLYELVASLTEKVYKPVDDASKKALTALLEGNKQAKDAAQKALEEFKAYLNKAQPGNAHTNK